jgi:ABC-type nitrate/sulfonate/bicarbonate transport system substrate-binding protein
MRSTKPRAIGILLWLFLLCGVVHAAETPLLQATAVYGVIATDPIYLWIAQDRGIFKKNGLNIDLTHIPTTQAV